jgi:formylglycine-generating enzyme required for sulfatase activity
LWYTVHQWAIANGYTFANAGKEGHDGSAGASPTAAKYEPVTKVNWRDCMVWCNAYSEMAGLGPVYYTDSGYTTVLKASSNSGGSVNTTPGSYDNPYVNWNATGYRLPTEGEWQYAASYQDGSTWTPYNYASGATADYINAAACQAVANYTEPDPDETKNVGSYQTNQLGIHDMSGNVSEWCWDWNADWPVDAKTDYRGPGSGSYRFNRGGSWYDPAYSLQVGFRYYSYPGLEDDGFGLRLVRR